MEEVIEASAPRLNVGRKICVLHQREWRNPRDGQLRKSWSLSEVVPAEMVMLPDGRSVVKSWRRAYKGVSVSMESLKDWASFAGDLHRALNEVTQKRAPPVEVRTRPGPDGSGSSDAVGHRRRPTS